MRVTLTPSRLASTDLEVAECSFDELAALLDAFSVGDKDGDAIIPALFDPCPPRCRNHGTKSKDCGGGSLHRLNANARAVTGLGLDVDEADEVAFQSALEQLRQRGVAHAWWRTHSYGTKPGARARVLVPFAEELELPVANYWRNVAWPALVRELGFSALIDPSCADPARVYYTPRKPTAEAPHTAGHHVGELFDWKPLLGNPALFKPEARAAVVPETEEEDPTRPVDLDDVRSRLRMIRRKGKDLLQKVCLGSAPVRPPQFRMPSDLQREPAWFEITKFLAIVAHAWESTEALLEVLRPSWQAETIESPTDHTDWEHIVDQFVRARPKAPEWRAASKAKAQETVELFRRTLRAREAQIREERGEEPPPPPSEDDPEPVDPDAWLDKLIVCPDGQGSSKVKSCGSNVALILENSAEWGGAFRKNLLGGMVEICGGPTHEGEPRWLSDTDVTRVLNWFETSEHSISLPKYQVRDQILITAERCAYDPLTTYLKGLRWDGIARLDRFLEELLGAKTSDSKGEDITRYVRAVSRKFFVSAVARALNPGSKVDTMLVLCGEQGEKKSTAVEVLASGFYADTSIPANSKDFQQLCGSHWMIELSEMESLSKVDATAQKSTLSRRVDVFRPPYGTSPISQPRRCIFVGTTNKDDYLSDPTGSRRYWPINCQHVEIEKVKELRDQLWAEAVVAFLAGEQWWLAADEQVIANSVAEQTAESDSYADAVQAWIVSQPAAKRPKEIRLVEIWKAINGGATNLPTRGEEVRLGNALRRLKVRRRRGRREGVLVWFYETPAEWLEAPEPIKRPTSLPITQARSAPSQEKP